MVAVRYTCPRCGSVVDPDRDAHLADRSVTPEPLDGWEHAPAHEPFEAADGVEFVPGASETRGEGCGRPLYLSFVRFGDGRAVGPSTPPADPPNFGSHRRPSRWGSDRPCRPDRVAPPCCVRRTGTQAIRA